MKLIKGQLAPNFTAIDIHGEEICLYQLKNKKILLSFFRYSECALCNLRIAEMNKRSKELKDLGVKIIVIFQSSRASLLNNIYNKHSFDFTIISDEDFFLYKLYSVTVSWGGLIRTFSLKGFKSIFKASKMGYKIGGNIEGKLHQIPADFLINDNKVLELVHYGNSLIDHVPFDELFI